MFIPEFIPVPAMYIPKLFPDFIVPVFLIKDLFPRVLFLAAIPADDVPVAPLTSRTPLFIPSPSSTYIPILFKLFIVIFPFEIRDEFPCIYEAILFDVPAAVDSIFLVLISFTPPAAYIPILSFPISLIVALLVKVFSDIPLL